MSVSDEACKGTIAIPAPKYKTFDPGLMKILSKPPSTPAASLELQSNNVRRCKCHPEIRKEDQPERIPNTVFSLDSRGITLSRGLDSNSLLTIDRISRGQVLGDKHVFLATSDEDTGVTMGFDNGFLTTLGTTTGSTTTATTTSLTRY